MLVKGRKETISMSNNVKLMSETLLSTPPVNFLARAKAVLDRVQYKAGWQFHISGDGTDIWLQVRFATIEPPIGIQHGRTWRLSEYMTDGEIVQTALAAVLAAEEHEARERFTYCGRAIFHPHYDLEVLWEMAGREGSYRK